MKMNEESFHGKWEEIKGSVRSMWGKLTDDELEKTKGDVQQISGLIMQRYGDTKADSTKKLEEIFNRFKTNKDNVVNNVNSSLKS